MSNFLIHIFGGVYQEITLIWLIAYSRWPPKWRNYVPDSMFSCPQSTVMFAWISMIHMFLFLRDPWKIYKFGSFAYTRCLAKWCSEQPHILLKGSQVFICNSDFSHPYKYVNLAHLHINIKHMNIATVGSFSKPQNC